MNGDKQIITHLNKVLYNELVAINQYFLHAKILKNWGFDKMATKVWEESKDEMNQADILCDRILFLEGVPNLQDLGKLHIGQNLREILECDLKLEQKAIPDLREGIKHAESVGDYVTRDLLDQILSSEEEHLDWLETQLELYSKIGEQNYLQMWI